MTRMSKQGSRRAVSPRRTRKPSIKTGSRKDNLAQGFKPHANAIEGNSGVFIGKVK
jgi:hypothetical protein